jgi:hypothetical protein
MKGLTPNEILSFTKLIQMETNALAMSKASVNLISDKQLMSLYKTGITAAEARITGLQQFVSENQIIPQGGVQ